MQDVADHAGISRATVSYVLNDTPDAERIPEETKARIHAAVEELGYRPNAMAKGLRSRTSNILGFIADEIATTPFSGDIIKGAQDAAWNHGKVLNIVNTDRQATLERAAVDTMLERQAEGILFATMFHREIEPPDNLHELPAILVDCYSRERDLPSVVPDEAGGGRTATEHLLEQGHRRIAMINGKRDLPATVGRTEGYRRALAAHDLPVEESLVVFTGWWQEDGYEAALELLRRPEPPTAIFCANDRIAMGAYDAIKELGLSIPGDVAIVGFDNQEVIAAHLRPKLTTMALPYYEMGQWAVEYLLEHADAKKPTAPPQVALSCPLIVRESSTRVPEPSAPRSRAAGEGRRMPTD